MKVSNYVDTQPTEEAPGVFKREVITDKDGAPNFCMRVFEAEPGSSTPTTPTPGNTRYLYSPARGWWWASKERPQ